MLRCCRRPALHNLRFFARATGWFAGLALLLGAAGVHSVVSADQRRRMREIGLRLALGALPRQAAALVAGNALRLIALGLLIGGFCAVPVLGWLREELFLVDRAALLGLSAVIALTLTIAGLAAAAWPAWRASRTPPMETLRHE